MQKVRITYESNLDALVSISKRFNTMENQYNMASEDFFHQYSNGLLEDSVDYMEWSNAYRHYLVIYKKLEKKLKNVA